MDESGNIPNIPIVENNVKFWMIRTKEGFFFDEFIREGFIAIGWNAVTMSDICGGISGDRENYLKEKVRKIYGGTSPGAAVNKCVRFCRYIKDGDIAMIVGEYQVAFAEIGEYFESEGSNLTPETEIRIHKEIEKAHIDADRFSCPYIKRREIKVLRVLERNAAMNPYLVNVMAVNRHSLSDLTDFAEIILSSCYDAFIFRAKLTLAFRVKQENNISAVDLAEFVLYAARIISEDEPSKVAVKTALHSPGDILLQIIDFVKDNSLPLLICYLAVFGGRVKDYEFHSVLGVIREIIDRNYNKEKQRIELRKLEAEADLAEQRVLSEKLNNIERQRAMHMDMVQKYAQPLAEASARLQIQPDQDMIINIADILDKTQRK